MLLNFFSQCAITMMMVKLLPSFYVMPVGICVQIVTDSFISIDEQKLIRDRYSWHHVVCTAYIMFISAINI